jgi:Ca2+-binding RTX toxin-like protein
MESRESRGGGNDGGSIGFNYLVNNSFCYRLPKPPVSCESPVPEGPFGPDSGFQIPWRPPLNCWPPRQPVEPPSLCPKPEAWVFTDYSSRPPKTVVDAGDGDDQIRVSCNPGQPGGVIVDVNGEKHYLTAEQARNLEIRGGRGNDTIIVDQDVQVGHWFDRLNNRGITIDGGRGDDFIVGSRGNDTIRGGRGNDTIIGSEGDDNISGGRGDDSIFGGGGNDRIAGGRGNDAIWGGEGDDTINGGRGDDTIIDWAGNNRIRGGRGRNNIIDDWPVLLQQMLYGG